MKRALALGLVLGLIFAGRASAVLVYQRLDSQQLVARHEIVAAHNDGAEPHVVAHGFLPWVSPNGHRIAYFVPSGDSQDLYVVGIAGRHRRLAARDVHGVEPNASVGWSPNGRYVVVGDIHGLGGYLVDLRKQKRRHIGTEGSFGGASFRPDSLRFVIGDIVGADRTQLIALRVERRGQQPLGDGSFPVWGRGGIAFARQHRILVRKRIGDHAHVLLDEDFEILHPVDWSRDGRALLVAEGPNAGLKALLIRPKDGNVTRVPVDFAEVAAVSRNGHEVLGESNGDVIAATSDGSTRVLAHQATSPSWTR